MRIQLLCTRGQQQGSSPEKENDILMPNFVNQSTVNLSHGGKIIRSDLN